MKVKFNKLARLALVPMAALAAGAAKAQTSGAIDVSGVVTKINDQMTPIGLIGGACLVLVVGVAAFMWVRKAIR